MTSRRAPAVMLVLLAMALGLLAGPALVPRHPMAPVVIWSFAVGFLHLSACSEARIHDAIAVAVVLAVLIAIATGSALRSAASGLTNGLGPAFLRGLLFILGSYLAGSLGGSAIKETSRQRGKGVPHP